MSTRDSVLSAALTWARRVFVVLALTVLAFFGGVAVTQLWPVQTQTQFFSAQVSVEPRLDSTVRLPTVIGDLEMVFEGALPAPGLTGQVQVREEVTDLLRRGQLRTADLEPDQDELRAAIGSGVQEVAWKFAAGALVTTALVLLTYALSRPRNAGKALIVVGTASTLALGGPGLAAFLAYRTGQVSEFRTTSFLSAVQASGTLLSDLENRSDQGAIYVTNLLALSEAMRQEFSPGEDDTPTAARFLLVSDIHGLNQYQLMAEIVRTEQITAVIDTGDIVNFGQPQELDLTQLRSGIENLGVPYLFVRGNHDAVDTYDERVLRSMGRIPNVVLLEPTAGELVRVNINGVTISGFNDRRFFNERSDDFGAVQSDLAARYRDATADLEATDIILTHQPYAATRVRPAGVTVSGHMHRADLNVPNIVLGSFTGGGLVNQFRIPPLTEEAREAAEEDPETAGRLESSTYSFDVLTFDTDCAISSLTRYSYRNLVSGRPQYDDISMVNGATLQATVPQDRVCDPELGMTIEDWATLPEPAEDAALSP